MVFNAPILDKEIIGWYMLVVLYNPDEKQAREIADLFSKGVPLDEALGDSSIDQDKLRQLIDAILGNSILPSVKFDGNDYLAVMMTLYECVVAAQEGREPELFPEMITVWTIFNGLSDELKDYIYKVLEPDST